MGTSVLIAARQKGARVVTRLPDVAHLIPVGIDRTGTRGESR